MSRRKVVSAMVLFGALVSIGSATPATRVVGGTTIQIQDAPWTVFVEQDRGLDEYVCTGSIIDPTHVLTAAHCVYAVDGTRAEASDLTVKAGVSNFSDPLPTDSEQERSVELIRVHPGFRMTHPGVPDDVAVLVLSSPLELGLPTAKAVRLPKAGAPFPNAVAVGVAGFGIEMPTAEATGPLEWMVATVDAQGACDSFGGEDELGSNGVLLCSSSLTAAPCEGDSGSALVTLRGPPTILGVVDAGVMGCPAGSSGLFAYVGAPEILRFVEGDDHPPLAPRGSSPVHLTWPTPFVVGSTLRCTAPGWAGKGRITYEFTDGLTLQNGPRGSYVVRERAVYNSIACVIAVRNAGGTTLVSSRLSPVAIKPS